MEDLKCEDKRKKKLLELVKKYYHGLYFASWKQRDDKEFRIQ